MIHVRCIGMPSGETYMDYVSKDHLPGLKDSGVSCFSLCDVQFRIDDNSLLYSMPES